MKVSDSCSSCRRWIWAATLLSGIFGFNHQAWSQEKQGAMVGRQAPPFRVQGVYGETYSLESFKGHILVMQFGASW